MPTNQFLEDLVPGEGQTQFSSILKYAVDNLPVIRIKHIKYLLNGQKEVALLNASDEVFLGTGDTKTAALAECISLKYPG
jgi:hypothetical protein